MKLFLSLLAFVVFALIVPFLIPGVGRQEGINPEQNLPWQIDVDGQGRSAVFGLRLEQSTLIDAEQKLGGDMEVAIIAAPDEEGSVEAYFSQVALGFVLARVILTVDVPKAEILSMRERALRSKHMESTTRKITLHPDDLARVRALPIRAIGVIPNANLDEAVLIQRFGQPGERLVVSEKRVHLLYPGLGVDAIVDGEGKELLQYVAPRRFGELREPLAKGQ